MVRIGRERQSSRPGDQRFISCMNWGLIAAGESLPVKGSEGAQIKAHRGSPVEPAEGAPDDVA